MEYRLDDTDDEDVGDFMRFFGCFVVADDDDDDVVVFL